MSQKINFHRHLFLSMQVWIVFFSSQDCLQLPGQQWKKEYGTNSLTCLKNIPSAHNFYGIQLLCIITNNGILSRECVELEACCLHFYSIAVGEVLMKVSGNERTKRIGDNLQTYSREERGKDGGWEGRSGEYTQPQICCNVNNKE